MTGAALSTPAAGTDFPLSDAQFERIGRIMRLQSGICLADGAQKLVVSRLSKHLKRLGLPGFEAYLDFVTGPQGAEEQKRMIDALTTNTTRFFREEGHFRLLETGQMPRLIRKAREGGRVRLWSAACSSGEEPYSMAATVLRAFPDAGQHDFRILATDINTAMLTRAKAAIYAAEAARDVPADLARLMFEPGPGPSQVRVRQPLRDLVSFRYLNFMEPWPVRGPFDAIFCRNVTIYMEPEIQMRIWTGLERVLDEEGSLFIGHSERIGPSLADRLELYGPTSFRRPGSRPTSTQSRIGA
ncbi:CheR family methyltransferase [Oceaniglobus roseus]|uniref:CheR family methyltransferase n=1 Tax=Oceaniglobus roseus TaxID=1737570 RepID=UPI000C7EF342|nr:CheR family methyltransferase [Kandeliimicrobium roseum]